MAGYGEWAKVSGNFNYGCSTKHMEYLFTPVKPANEEGTNRSSYKSSGTKVRMSLGRLSQAVGTKTKYQWNAIGGTKEVRELSGKRKVQGKFMKETGMEENETSSM